MLVNQKTVQGRRNLEFSSLLPKSAQAVAFPDVGSAEEAMEQLRKAVARTKTERMEAAHPAFGNMTHDEWVKLHLRHSEMHLSFAHSPSAAKH